VVPPGVVFKDNIVFAKIKNTQNIDYNFGFNLLINSSLIGYYLFQISGQWGKGDQKWAALRTKDIQELPICDVEKLAAGNLPEFTPEKIEFYQDVIDEKIFDLYKLTDYEKEIIKEFYEINVKRASGSMKMV